MQSAGFFSMSKLHIYLTRFHDQESGTFGYLRFNDLEFSTVERPWLNNERNISCIPAGTYICRRYSSDKFPNTFEVCDVPGRSHILFHVANFQHEVEGCIGIAKGRDACGEMITSSRQGFNEFIEELKYIAKFELTINWKSPEHN